ncbi:PHD and RING finger domain containing protein [Gracilaria domingensis]|nr:PHD and RING finger domain containing protein [Gracilaria domingensis]
MALLGARQRKAVSHKAVVKVTQLNALYSLNRANHSRNYQSDASSDACLGPPPPHRSDTGDDVPRTRRPGASGGASTNACGAVVAGGGPNSCRAVCRSVHSVGKKSYLRAEQAKRCYRASSGDAKTLRRCESGSGRAMTDWNRDELERRQRTCPSWRHPWQFGRRIPRTPGPCDSCCRISVGTAAIVSRIARQKGRSACDGTTTRVQGARRQSSRDAATAWEVGDDRSGRAHGECQTRVRHPRRRSSAGSSGRRRRTGPWCGGGGRWLADDGPATGKAARDALK